jgi:hypothetical protein
MRTALLLLFSVLVGHADEATLNPHLQPLAPLLGKTFKGAMKDADGKTVATDVSRWEAVLNGQAVRITHSVNDGVYGGESIIRWDAEKAALAYYYFTTAGFYTTGTVHVDGNRILTEEAVHGNAGGIDGVKAVTELLPDGGFKVSVSHLRKGQWEKAGERTYQVDPTARVVFKEIK